MTIRDWIMVVGNLIFLTAFGYLLWRTWPKADPPVWMHRKVIGHVVESRLDDSGFHVTMQIDDVDGYRTLMADVETFGGFSIGPISTEERHEIDYNEFTRLLDPIVLPQTFIEGYIPIDPAEDPRTL